jgi:putative endonuclease
MFVVYAIESLTTGRVYIGQTADIDNRLKLHNACQVKSTSMDGPWYVLAMEEFDMRNKARWCETQLKRSRGRRQKWLLDHVV